MEFEQPRLSEGSRRPVRENIHKWSEKGNQAAGASFLRFTCLLANYNSTVRLVYPLPSMPRWPLRTFGRLSVRNPVASGLS